MNAALGQTLMNLQFYSTSQTSKPTEQQQQQYQQNPSITYQQAAQMKGIGNANQQQQQQQHQQEMALNLSRSLQQQQPVNIVNMTSNKLLQPQQIQLQQHQIQQIQLQHQQQQPQLLETLMHAVPNATSTPNPIQQQQQDIFTNLLLKFDPTQFFVPKKDQLSFIFNNSGQTGAATTTASVSQNPTVIQFVQPVKQAQQPHQQFIQQQLQPQQPQHFQIIQQQPHQQQMQIQMQHQQQQHQIYLQHQQQQQQIYQQQQQQQQQFNGMANQSRLGQLVSASAVSTGSGGNVKQTPQQPPQSQNDDSSNDSDEEGNSTLGGNPHEKPYKCSQCFKLFRKKVHLNQHMRIHSGERPYACDFCEKRFTQLSHLWQHTRRHTGDKPYKCDVGSCDKAFSQLSNLQSHIRTHGSGAVSAHLTTVTNPTTTAAAPQSPVSTAISDAIAAVSGGQTTTTSSNNKCTKCWKQFSSKDELAAHMSTRHAGKAARNQLKRHFCEICHKRFATEGVIRTHVCSKLPNAVLVRNSEGSLVMRSNSALPQLINK